MSKDVTWAQLVRQSSGELDSPRSVSPSSLSSTSPESTVHDKEIEARLTAEHEQFNALLALKTAAERTSAITMFVPDFQKPVSLFEAVGQVLKKHYDLTNYGNEEPLNRPTIADDIHAEKQKAFAIRGLKFVLDSILPKEVAEAATNEFIKIALNKKELDASKETSSLFPELMKRLKGWTQKEDALSLSIQQKIEDGRLDSLPDSLASLQQLREENILKREQSDKYATLTLLTKYSTDPKFFNNRHDRNNNIDSAICHFRGQSQMRLEDVWRINDSSSLPIEGIKHLRPTFARSVATKGTASPINDDGNQLYLGIIKHQCDKLQKHIDSPDFTAPSNSASSNSGEQLKEDRMTLLQERIRVRLLQDCFFGKCTLQDVEKTMLTFQSIEPAERNFIKEFYSKATELFKAAGDQKVNEKFAIPTSLKGQELEGFIALLNDAQKYTGRHTSALAGISFAAGSSAINVTIKDTPGRSLRPEGQMLQSLTKMILEQARNPHTQTIKSEREAKSGRCSIM